MASRVSLLSSRRRFSRSPSKTAEMIRKKKAEVVDLTKQRILHRVFENHDNLAVVYEVREELMENVMKKCYENDIQKKSVSFVLKCAYQAMLQILNLEFYVHDSNQSEFLKNSEWTADEAPDSSPADTWAGYNVPTVAHTEENVEEVSGAISLETVTLTEVDSATKHCSLMSEPCSLISEAYISQSLSEYSASLLGPNVSEELLPESIVEEEDVISEIETERSLFTKIATFATDVETSKIYSEYRRRETLKFPKIPKLTDDRKSRAEEVKISASMLPPLRADTLLQKGGSSDCDKRKSQK